MKEVAQVCHGKHEDVVFAVATNLMLDLLYNSKMPQSMKKQLIGTIQAQLNELNSELGTQPVEPPKKEMH